MELTDFTDFLGITNTQNVGQPQQQPQGTQQQPQPQSDQPAQPQQQPRQPKKERETLYTWETFSRPTIQKFSKKTTKTFMIIGVIISLLLVAMQEFFLILVILSLIFVYYMLSQMPPDKIRYEITNQGIKYGERFYAWHELGAFFLTQSYDIDAIAIDVPQGIPSRLFLTVKAEDKEKIRDMLDQYLYYLEEEPKTFVDRAYESVIDKINLER